MINEVLDLIITRTKDNPILSLEIEEALEMSGGEVREIIRELRRKRTPIANSQKGYYLARTYEEIEPTINNLHSRAMSQLVTIKELRNSFNRNTQIEIIYE